MRARSLQQYALLSAYCATRLYMHNLPLSTSLFPAASDLVTSISPEAFGMIFAAASVFLSHVLFEVICEFGFRCN